MFRSLTSGVVDPTMKDFLAGMEKDGKVVSPEQTASVLAEILQRDEFESGARVVFDGEVSQLQNHKM